MFQCESFCFCYPDSVVWYYVTNWSFVVGGNGWWALSALRWWATGELWLYFSILVWWLLLFVEVIIRAYAWQYRPCSCYHHCISISDGGMPCPEVLYAAGLFSYLWAFDALLDTSRIYRKRNLLFIAVLVFVSANLWWTNNYTLEQVLVSGVAGSLVGCATAAFFYFQFSGTTHLVVSNSVFRFIRFKDTVFVVK